MGLRVLQNHLPTYYCLVPVCIAGDHDALARQRCTPFQVQSYVSNPRQSHKYRWVSHLRFLDRPYHFLHLSPPSGCAFRRTSIRLRVLDICCNWNSCKWAFSQPNAIWINSCNWRYRSVVGTKIVRETDGLTWINLIFNSIATIGSAGFDCIVLTFQFMIIDVSSTQWQTSGCL